MKIVRGMKKISRLQGEVSDLKNRISKCLNEIEENEFIENFKELQSSRRKCKLWNLKFVSCILM